MDKEALLSVAIGPQARATLEKVALALIEQGMNTHHRAAGVFGNFGHESLDLSILEENLNYSANRLMQVWPHRYRTVDQAAKYARNPEALANNTYANRMGNGPESSGDGWRFRGRGPIQLTGRNNYTACDKDLKLGILDDPDRVKDLEIGFQTGLWFFTSNNLLRLCDNQDWLTLTKRINGGTHGHSDRVNRIERGLRASGAPVRPRTMRRGHKGPDVAAMQEVLGITADGIFGKGTEGAVKEWQRDNNLVADGVVGPATKQAMGLA